MPFKVTLKINKARNMLRTGANASAHNMNEKDTMDEVEPVTLSTLFKQGMTEMSKRIKKMLSVHCIYVTTYRNLAEEQEIDTEEQLSWETVLVLADPSYGVQRGSEWRSCWLQYLRVERYEELVQSFRIYDEASSACTRALLHSIICFWNTAIGLAKKEEQASTKKGFRMSKPRSKKNESIDVQPVF